MRALLIGIGVVVIGALVLFLAQGAPPVHRTDPSTAVVTDGPAGDNLQTEPMTGPAASSGSETLPPEPTDGSQETHEELKARLQRDGCVNVIVEAISVSADCRDEANRLVHSSQSLVCFGHSSLSTAIVQRDRSSGKLECKQYVHPLPP